MPEMTTGKRKFKALALLSGGLDSILAAYIVRSLDVAVEGISFESPFFKADRARRAAAAIDLALHVVDFTDEIIAVLHNPKHGFGSCMNPCIDCHTAMIRVAGGLLAAREADFIISGEVLNQRPMSQTRQSLAVVAAGSGFADLLVRPLSAKIMEPTRPEREGWIDREQLLGLSGRSRKPQMAMARQFGIRDYSTPAGGCLLTEPTFCARLYDLRDHGGLGDPDILRRLTIGRHYRFSPGVKLVVGRNQIENETLEKTRKPGEILLESLSVPGPAGILDAGASADDLLRSAAICAYHGDGKMRDAVVVTVTTPEGRREVTVRPATIEDVTRLRVA